MTVTPYDVDDGEGTLILHFYQQEFICYSLEKLITIS